MRKLFTFTFAAALAFTFAACETQNQETANTQDTVSNEVTPQDPAATEGEQAEAPEDTTQAQ